MTYSVYDFVNNDIESKHMRFGWRAEIEDAGLSSNYIVLRYRMLNFDESSLKFIGNDLWNMYLSSKSYNNMKQRMEKAMKKYKRLYFSGRNIEELKCMVSEIIPKMDVDKLIDTLVKKKSDTIKEKIDTNKQNVV